MFKGFDWRLRAQAPAEIVELRCPSCGHVFRFVGDDPNDRETEAFCAAGCSRDGFTPEYGWWVVREIGLIFADRIVFLREEDATAFKTATV